MSSGRLRATAVSSRQRVPALSQVPTFDESGLKGYETTNWFGLFAPARTPCGIVNRLNSEIDKVIRNPDLAERFANESLQVIGGPPGTFRTFVETEIEKYARVIKAAGIPKQ